MLDQSHRSRGVATRNPLFERLEIGFPSFFRFAYSYTFTRHTPYSHGVCFEFALCFSIGKLDVSSCVLDQVAEIVVCLICLHSHCLRTATLLESHYNFVCYSELYDKGMSTILSIRIRYRLILSQTIDILQMKTNHLTCIRLQASLPLSPNSSIENATIISWNTRNYFNESAFSELDAETHGFLIKDLLPSIPYENNYEVFVD